MRRRCLGNCGRHITAGSRCPACQASQKHKYTTSRYRTNRRLVLARDNYECQIRHPGCTHTATEADHINADGDSTLTNLQAACKHCNSGKRDR